ncbi:MAG: hypothetical protein R3Y50_05950 [Rikenellaceae bacterium]
MKINYKGEAHEAYSLKMQKKFAKEIVEGKKTLEIRAFSPYYISRFINKRPATKKGETVDIVSDIKTDVRFIHFSDYKKSWHLDVKIDELGICTMAREDIESLAEDFDFHDYDNEWQQYDSLPDEEKPIFFYLHICEIVESKGL